MAASRGGADGLLFDFLTRVREQARTVGPRDTDPLMQVLEAGQEPPSQGSRAGVKIPVGYEVAVSQIWRETLQCRLVEVVAPLLKARKDPAFAAPPAQLLKLKAEEVLKLRKQLECHRTELELWVAANPPRQPQAQKSAETTSERSQRVSKFWEKFHRGFRKGTPPSRAQEDSPRNGEKSPASPTTRVGGWKDRAARGRVPVAGRRSTCLGTLEVGDFGRRATAQARSPQAQRPGSSAAGDPFPPAGPLAPLGPGVPALDRRNSQSHLWSCLRPEALQGDEAGGSAVVAGMPGLRQSSSMPNLRKDSISKQVSNGSVLQKFGGIDVSPLAPKLVLPPIMNAHVPPHGSESPSGMAKKSGGSLANTYLKHCEDDGLVPLTMPFITGNSPKINACGKALTDIDLIAMASSAARLRVEDVDLSGNTLLTDRAMAKFIQLLVQEPCVTMLQRLCLRGCTSVGTGAQEALLTLVTNDASPLRHIDLSGVPLSMRMHQPLCSALGKHPCLDVCRLAEVGLGSNILAKQCVGELAASATMKTLDLSWNSFSPEVFAHLGERLMEAQVVRSLSLVNCSAAIPALHGLSPCMYMMEPLAKYKKLTHLDVSMNFIDFQGALVLEDGLLQATDLQELNVSGNPIGVQGMRSLLRLIMKKGRSAPRLLCDECVCCEPLPASSMLLDPAGAGGRYTIDLDKPYDRALLRALYRRCEHLGLSPADALIELSCSNPKAGFSVPSAKEASGLWPLPQGGCVVYVTYDLEGALVKAAAKAKVADWDFGAALRKYREAARPRPSLRKEILLLTQWLRMDKPAEQFAMLDALSQDFRLSYAFVALLCQNSRPNAGTIIARLMPCLMEARSSERFLALQDLATLGECVGVLNSCKSLLNFNVESPSGHYRLDLRDLSDRNVAESLLLLDRWEAGVAKRLSRRDVSERGDFGHIRGPRYSGIEFTNLSSVAHILMPERGVLELDYSSGRRRPESAEPLSDEVFEQLLETLRGTACTTAHQVEVIRATAHHLTLSASQLQQILCLFTAAPLKADVFVALIFAVVDIHEDGAVRGQFDDAEIAGLKKRMGYCTLFPFFMQGQVKFELDFAWWDQRLAAHILAQLASKEKRDYLAEKSLTNGEDVEEMSVVPKLWETTPEKMPKAGVFRAQYTNPEQPNMVNRAELLETFGFWPSKLPRPQTPEEN